MYAAIGSSVARYLQRYYTEPASSLTVPTWGNNPVVATATTITAEKSATAEIAADLSGYVRELGDNIPSLTLTQTELEKQRDKVKTLMLLGSFALPNATQAALGNISSLQSNASNAVDSGNAMSQLKTAVTLNKLNSAKID